MSATLRVPWGAYRAFIGAAFHRMLAYRLRYYTGVVTYLVYVTTYFFLWKAFYAGRPEGTAVGGFALADLQTYVVVGWLARSFYFNSVDREIARLVQEGELALAMVRPVSFPGLMMAEALGQSLFRVLFFTPPIALVLALVFPVRAPASVLHGAAFLLSCALSMIILVQLNFLVGISALKLKSIHGVIRAKHYFLELASGLLMPITFFPPAVAAVSRWLPFESIAYLPASLYLGRLEGAGLWRALGVQLFWAAFATVLVSWAWRVAARKVTIHGG